MTAETSQTLDRGLRALEVLAGATGGLSMTELAAALEVSRPVAYRLVATLEVHGYVRRTDDGRARLGFGVLHLARRVQPLLRTAALPALRSLAEQVGATAHLTVVDGAEALAVAVVEPSWTDLHVAYRVGTRHPLDKAAAGRAILQARATGVRAEPGASASSGPAGGDGGSAGGDLGLSAGDVGPSGGDAAPYVVSTGELQPGAHGVAAAVRGVPAVEASVGVVSLGALDPAVAGPRVVSAAAAVAAALR